MIVIIIQLQKCTSIKCIDTDTINIVHYNKWKPRYCTYKRITYKSCSLSYFKFYEQTQSAMKVFLKFAMTDNDNGLPRH